MSFSQRLGYVDFASTIQYEEMNDQLRTALWNAFYKELTGFYQPGNSSSSLSGYHYCGLLKHIWTEIFSRPIDAIPAYTIQAINALKPDFQGNAKWFNVYDIVEAHVKATGEYDRLRATNEYNRVLQKHGSAYRFIGTQLSKITSQEEISEVDSSLATAKDFPGVTEHIETAISLLSDRENPDYRNSIKESLSAVEGTCRVILEDSKITLGQAVKKLGGQGDMHPALQGALSKIYGYSSDSNGIRHSISDPNESVDYYEAKFLLVTCCAYINYLKGKQTNKQGHQSLAVGSA